MSNPTNHLAYTAFGVFASDQGMGDTKPKDDGGRTLRQMPNGQLIATLTTEQLAERLKLG